jgi:orotate phosphoribosyltransferase
MVAVFSYGFEIAKNNFDKKGLDLYTLSNYKNLLEQALDTGFINEKELEILSKWNANPSDWS